MTETGAYCTCTYHACRNVNDINTRGLCHDCETERLVNRNAVRAAATARTDAMTCKRCKGYLYREDEGYTCLMCGYRVEDVKSEPLDIPRKNQLFPIPPQESRRAVKR